MVPDAGGVTSVLLQHKEEILAWKSYVLQEAEAVSREAKIQWCRASGAQVINR